MRAGLPRPACEVLWHSVCAWRLALADGHGDNATELVWRICQAALEAYRPDDDNDPVYILLRKVGAEAAREQARCDFHAALEPAKIEAGEDADATPVHPYGDCVIEVAPEIVAAFALHFAEEILDLEQSLAANMQSPIPAVFAEVDRAAFDPAQPDGEVAEFAAMLEAEIARADVGELPDFAPEFAPGDIANDDAAAVPEIRPDVAAAA